jgi:arsenate reductase (thioredoxin)
MGDVSSAGLHAKGLDPYTVRVLSEQSCDLTPLYSKDVSEYLDEVYSAYVITVCGHADEHCPTISSPRVCVSGWSNSSCLCPRRAAML